MYSLSSLIKVFIDLSTRESSHLAQAKKTKGKKKMDTEGRRSLIQAIANLLYVRGVEEYEVGDIFDEDFIDEVIEEMETKKRK
ncbi:MAG: hypothetical protein NTY33_02700 [Candidatus Moranbacteria bacterium]|nr:hypothetical protein [Candidatus Moranbacteria bacterium]